MLNEQQYFKRKARRSGITAIISITVVLLVAGMFSLLLVYAQSLTNFVKSQLEVQMVLSPELSETKAYDLQKEVSKKSYTTNVKYVSREDALKIMSESLGENILEFAGENPFYASLVVTLNNNYANKDSLNLIKKELVKLKGVTEIYFQDSVLELVNKNVETFGYVLLFFGVILLLITVTLINNAIRLHLHAKRFLIKTMQLVGATRFFIQKPYLGRGILHGLIAGVLAVILLNVMLVYGESQIQELSILRNQLKELYVFVGLIAFGFVISFLSTYFAVSKYIRLRTEELY